MNQPVHPSLRLRRRVAALGSVVLFIAAVMNPLFVSEPAHASVRPSFRCVFTEPFTSFVVSSARIVLAPNDGNPDPHENLSATSVTKTGTRYRVVGNRPDGTRFAATIRKSTGSDGMSEFTTDYSAEIDGRPDSGACTKHHDGWAPAEVVGVADDDVLNVRAAGRTSARIVAKVGPSAIVFRAAKPVNGWVSVSVAVYPESGAGRVRVVEGWVNANFLQPYTA